MKWLLGVTLAALGLALTACGSGHTAASQAEAGGEAADPGERPGGPGPEPDPGSDPGRRRRPHALPLREGQRHDERLHRAVRPGMAGLHRRRRAGGRVGRRRLAAWHSHRAGRRAGHLPRPPALYLQRRLRPRRREGHRHPGLVSGQPLRRQGRQGRRPRQLRRLLKAGPDKRCKHPSLDSGARRA